MQGRSIWAVVTAGRLLLGSSVAFVAALMILVLAPGAVAEETFCPSGESAGQCDTPQGVAVDGVSGDVYVVDSGNSRINKFSSDGSFLLSFGWGVVDGSTQALQVCGPAATPPTTTCFKGLRGNGTGQINSGTPRPSIAVDSGGDVYVGPSDGRVQKFSGDGTFLRMWGWDVVESGPGNTPSNEFEVCVPAQGDVCQPGTSISVPGPDSQNPTPLSANGPGQISGHSLHLAIRADQTVYVGMGTNSSGGGGSGAPFLPHEAQVQRFSADGNYLETIPISGGVTGTLSGIAVDSSGELFLNTGLHQVGDEIISGGRYSAAGQFLAPFRFGIAMSIDGTDTAYQADLEGIPGSNLRMVSLFDVSEGGEPTPIRRFGYELAGEGLRAGGIAPRTDGAGVFVSLAFAGEMQPGWSNRIVAIPFPAAGPIVAPEQIGPTSVGNVKATLSALINPEGKETRYRFEYVDEEAYLDDKAGGGDGFDGGETILTPPQIMSQEDFNLHQAQALAGCPDPVSEAAEGKCLIPETKYRFRVLAEHEPGEDGNTPVEGEPFETEAAIAFGNAWSTDVGAESARLHTELNPLGIPTEAWFEYVDIESCQADLDEMGPGHCFDRAIAVPNVDEAEPPLDLGAGEDLRRASVSVGGLVAGQTYRYRLVAHNPLGDPIPGPTADLRTFARPTDIQACPNDTYRTGPAARLPDCRAFEMVSPIDKGNGDIIVKWSANNFPASFNKGAIDGSKLTYSSIRSFGDAESAPYTSQYMATRDSSKEEWVSRGISPPRGINILGVLNTLDTEYKYFSDDLCTAWLRHDSDPPKAQGAIEGYANIYKRHNCGQQMGSYEAITTTEPLGIEPKLYKPEIQAVSANGAHAVYRTEAVAVDGADASKNNVFDSVGGIQRLVCILPGGSPTNRGCSVGSNSHTDVVADDHRDRMVANAISSDGSRIFWSVGAAASNEIGRDLYVRINGHGQGNECVNPVRPCTVPVGYGQYWGAATDGSAALYVAPESSLSSVGELRRFDVDAAASTPIADRVVGVLGASDDLSRIYFLSRAALDGGAVAGEPNLYIYEQDGNGEEIEWIGTLTAAEASLGKPPSPVSLSPVLRTSRVTPDGRHLVFMSAAKLTGYDNLDAENGNAAAEVFRYAADSGSLACISCNPTGARPRGALFKVATAENGIWAAAVLPTPVNQLYAPRVISMDGQRVFFESFEGLVLGDTNGVQDVYQWEAVGLGSCTSSADGYVESADGCIARISAGTGPAEFVDASANGRDIFFTTGTSLVTHDPGLIDVYDARVNGGFEEPPSPPEDCEGGPEVCGSPPAPPLEQTPASGVGQGRGNVQSQSQSKNCSAPTRKAKKADANAKRARAKVRRANRPGASKGLRKQAKRLKKQAKSKTAKAKRLTNAAQRCRAARKAGGGNR